MARARRPITLLALAVVFGCSLSTADAGQAATRSYKPVKRGSGELHFKLSGLKSTEMHAAYVRSGTYRRALDVALVRKGAAAGLLRVSIRRHLGLRAPRGMRRDGSARPRYHRIMKGVRLVIVTYTSIASDEIPHKRTPSPWDERFGDLSNLSSCDGVALTPASDLQAAINARPIGTTFCLQPGTYYLTKSIQTRSYDRFIGQPGVIFDGQGKAANGFWGYGGDTGQVHVAVKNIVFRNFTGAAVRLGWYAYVAHNEVHDNQIGVWVNSYSSVDANYIHDNYQYGITGGPGRDVLIENNELAHNNTSHNCSGTCIGDAGGSKIVGSTAGTHNLTWRNNYVHDNIGVGIWSDGNVRSSLYEYNRVESNSGSGIEHEISWNATVRYNTLTDNDSRHAGRSCGYGGQLMIANSTNVEAYHNTVTASNGTNGICAIDILRPDVAVPRSQAVANLYVHDNVISMRNGASTGLVGRATALNANNRFVNNTFRVDDMVRGYWAWPGSTSLATWTTWHALNQDVTGFLSRWE